jgi:superfamily II DNA or RNA helicase
MGGDKPQGGEVRVPILKGDRGYRIGDLFLPLDSIMPDAVIKMLTFTTNDGPLCVARKHPRHLEIPRNSISEDQLRRLGVEVSDLTPTSFKKVHLRPGGAFKLRPEQEDAVAAMERTNGDGTLNLACGRGKTVLSWYRACQLGGPVLFLAPQIAHLSNAEKELRTFFDVKASIGHMYKGSTDWNHDIVFATVSGLANMVKSGRLPPEFHRYFALTIYDEAHHISAGHFVYTANISQGRRLGLTAEKKRTDGLEQIFLGHLGSICYSDIEPDLVPTVMFHKTGIVLSEDEDAETKDVNGAVHMAKLRRVLGSVESRNRMVVQRIKSDLSAGRTVYVISHSPEHAELLHQRFPGSGLILQRMDADERLRQLNTGKLVFTTVGIGAESYNRKDLDTLHLVTPPGAKKDVAIVFNQCVGRILRSLDGKPDPIARVYHDENIDVCNGLIGAMSSFCYEKGWKVVRS